MQTEFTPRMDYYGAAPELYGQLATLSQKVNRAGLEPTLVHLVEMRASQLNGCAFCLDMHAKQAKLAGERELRLYVLPTWRESPLFTPRERAALAYTEAVTHLGAHGVDDATFADLRAHFTDPEVAQLALLVAVINAWNRIAIPFRATPGSMDKAYGLDKAGLK